MNSEEHRSTYTSTGTYSTLGNLSETTKMVWFVCHGMGQLSRYFIKNFEPLDKNEHYILAPQAPSKYYLRTKRKRVGASWLTIENTIEETKNVLRYFDSILDKENLPDHVKLVILGYSQGVSVAMRYVASRKIKFDSLVLVSGGIPIELSHKDFEFIKDDATIYCVYATEDQFLSSSKVASETEKLYSIFNESAKIITYKGNHDFELQKWIDQLQIF